MPGSYCCQTQVMGSKGEGSKQQGGTTAGTAPELSASLSSCKQELSKLEILPFLPIKEQLNPPVCLRFSPTSKDDGDTTGRGVIKELKVKHLLKMNH